MRQLTHGLTLYVLSLSFFLFILQILTILSTSLSGDRPESDTIGHPKCQTLIVICFAIFTFAIQSFSDVLSRFNKIKCMKSFLYTGGKRGQKTICIVPAFLTFGWCVLELGGSTY
jgi:hypothetical protein